MLDFIRNVRYLHIIHVSVIIFSFIFMPSYWNGVVDSVRPTPLNKHIDIFSAHTQAHTYKRYANGCRQLADQYQRDNIENEKQTMPCHKRAAAVTPPINCYFFFIFFFVWPENLILWILRIQKRMHEGSILTAIDNDDATIAWEQTTFKQDTPCQRRSSIPIQHRPTSSSYYKSIRIEFWKKIYYIRI